MNTGPYNDLENQVRHDPETGEILEIYDPPTSFPWEDHKPRRSMQYSRVS